MTKKSKVKVTGIEHVEEAWTQVFEAMQLLELEGESPSSDISNSPRRVAKMWMEELLSGYRSIESLKKVFTQFDASDAMPVARDMIVQDNIPFSSMCAHHLLPFRGVAHIGYIPGSKIVGLSKLARVLDYYSKRLQTQERLTSQVADFLEEELKPEGVIVVTQAEHMCMTIRGVNKPGSMTSVPALRGVFNEAHAKSEFYSLLTVYPRR